MTKCLICHNEVDSFMSFGKMPIANGFLMPEHFNNEYFFELKVGYCPICHMVQLLELVDESKMFHDEYAFYSSTSVRMQQHFKELADHVCEKYLKDRSTDFVVEIGSNDGILLQNFAKRGIRHIGIEPSANVAAEARKKGVNSISRFFDEKVAGEIVSEYGKADVFLGANVMCHIPYLHSVVEGIRILLKLQGVLIFEDPYLGDIIQKTSYDQIYDEHAFYFSVASLSYLFEQHGMEIIDVSHQNVHGGSMRYVVGHIGAHNVSESVTRQKQIEEKIGIYDSSTYHQMKKNIEQSKTELLKLLHEFKMQGKSIVGYGATSKSTTVINYCGITADLVEFISDTTPIKQGRYSPGLHIPVRDYKFFTEKYPDYALLFAWNHGEEIMEKERIFLANGGKFIVYVPQVKVMG